MMKKEKLTAAHEKFLKSVDGLVLGEFLVGSFVYSEEKDLSEKTDLDIICVIRENQLEKLLQSKYLDGLIDISVAKDVLKNKVSDYLVLKLYIDDILLSVDVLLSDFFEKICNIDLTGETKSYISHKYGNEPQLNSYMVSEFSGTTHSIQKKSEEYRGGYSIELPLFFISSTENYIYGIPTIKYITHKIFRDPKGIILKNLDKFCFNLAKRLIKEYPDLDRKTYENYVLNILIGRRKFPKEYRTKLLNKICALIYMEKKIESIRKEIYSLFKNDVGERKYSYVRRDWIFPNHLDVMIDLSRGMCQKYGGDESVCEIAILLHDVGLVYGREDASPEGHERRGIEYAQEILKKNNIPSEMQEEIIECIKTTNIKEMPVSINAKIVRTADALSQFISTHFFAKAAFSGDWEFYSKWLERKATNNFKKICFDDEIKQALPIRNYILSAIKLYKKNKKDYPKDDIGIPGFTSSGLKGGE